MMMLKYDVVVIVLGLLSSSCCIIQLVLNLFSIGCAGFALLTPFRTVFITLLVVSFAIRIYLYGVTRALVLSLLVSVLLTFSTELVAQFNASSSLKSSEVPAIVFTVHGVKCEACASRVKAALMDKCETVRVHLNVDAQQRMCMQFCLTTAHMMYVG
eukprot:TRINITY_DN10952_c0_g1_i1.p1 TRINITY_DN10952_c0_g1~~TRINITY_DN10952_c0_g1_i1.p1  ORF type:complete len:157 (-),score=22.36 TRINITY_DN10952_c0_g1_i1:154-624(-)